MLTVNHPWHGAHYGEHAPQKINALIEIPQGPGPNMKWTKLPGCSGWTGLFIHLSTTRSIMVLYHKPLDRMVIRWIFLYCAPQSIQSLCLVEANVIGNMQMIDTGQVDDKIIAVASKDPSVSHYQKMEDLPQHFLLELRNFFEQYKVLENKKVGD